MLLRLKALGAHLSARPLYTGTSSASRIAASIRTMASLPSTMKGVVINKTGGVEVLEHKTDLPVPKPKDGEILVKNTTVGVNFIDNYFRSGLYPTPHFPYTLGRDGEGTIASLPTGANKFGFKEGDRVVYLHEGSYAEYNAVPAEKLYKIPANVPEQTAVAAMLQGLTALTLIKETHDVKKGDWVFIHAAAGGVGLLLVQLVKAVGAHSIVTASTEEKRKLAADNGADVTLGYDEQEIRKAVDKHTNGQGVVAVFDGVGKTTFDLSLDLVARKGTLASFGNASGPPEPLVIQRLSKKNVKVARPTLFHYIATREEFETYTGQLLDFIAKGQLNIRIHDVYPLSEVARAHTDIQGRGTTGKLLLDPSK